MDAALAKTGSFLEAARGLQPLVRESAGEGNIDRELSKEVAEAIIDGGFLQNARAPRTRRL